MRNLAALVEKNHNKTLQISKKFGLDELSVLGGKMPKIA